MEFQEHKFDPKQQQRHGLFRRAQDIDDDSEDDDDIDSEEENEDPQVKKKMRVRVPSKNDRKNASLQEQKDYSVDIEKLKVIPGTGSNGLKEANAVVDFVINSNEPKPLGAVRLLLQGEARAGSMWYEFVRFKV